jgi:hypothetical protein
MSENFEDIHPELVDLQDLIFNPMLDAGMELHKRIGLILKDRDAAREEAERLRAMLDSRPAINAGLPETYIEWSQGVYLADAASIAGVRHD